MIIGALPLAVERFTLDDISVRTSKVALRPPGPAEVVVRAAGIALSDRTGTEISGEVVAAGEAAAEWLGKRVVVPRLLPCGECERCRRGSVASCKARAPRLGAATHETVPARYLCSVEPPLWPAGEELWRLAALSHAASSVYSAIVRAGLAPSELLVVIGAGVRGRLAIAMGRAKGAEVAVIDSSPARREGARAAGARFVLDAVEPAEALAHLLGEIAGAGMPEPRQLILETTATAAGRFRALAMLDAGATAVLLDGGDHLPRPAPPPPWEILTGSEAQILAISAGHPDLLPELCALVVRGELELAPLVTAVPPEAAAVALAARRRGELHELPIVRLAR